MKNIIPVLAILIIPIMVYSILHKNSSEISAIAVENNKPSLMIFTSSMCMDCQKMKAIIKEVESDYSDKINFVHINATDSNKQIKELVKKHNVVLVPTMVFMNSNNNEVNRVEGSISKEELVSDIKEAINE